MAPERSKHLSTNRTAEICTTSNIPFLSQESTQPATAMKPIMTCILRVCLCERAHRIIHIVASAKYSSAMTELNWKKVTRRYVTVPRIDVDCCEEQIIAWCEIVMPPLPQSSHYTSTARRISNADIAIAKIFNGTISQRVKRTLWEVGQRTGRRGQSMAGRNPYLPCI